MEGWARDGADSPATALEGWMEVTLNPQVTDEGGNTNNLLEVERESSDDGDSDSWEKVSLEEVKEEKAAKAEGQMEVKTEKEDEKNNSTTEMEVQASVMEVKEEPAGEESAAGEPKEEVVETPEASSILEREVSSLEVEAKVEARVTVVERVFGARLEATVEALKAGGAELVEEREYRDQYWDTPSFQLLRLGLWLRRREGAGAGADWQLRRLSEGAVLRVVEEQAQVVARLAEELGAVAEEGCGVEEVARRHSMKEILGFQGRTSRWRLGGTEVEVRKESEVETAVVRVEGEVLSALQEMQGAADKLHLLPLHTHTLGGGAA